MNVRPRWPCLGVAAKPWFAHALFACMLACCGSEIEQRPPTQITARISIDAAVRARMSELRVRCFAQRGDLWESGTGRSIGVDVIGDVVDVAFVPRPGTARDRPFEIIAEALDGTEVLAQERSLVTFVPEQQRLREMRLEPCGTRALGAICEVDPSCHGPRCLRCVDAACGPTTVVPGDELPPLGPTEPVPPVNEGDRGDMSEEPGRDTRAPDERTPGPTVDGSVPAREDAGSQSPASPTLPACVIGKAQLGRCVLR